MTPHDAPRDLLGREMTPREAELLRLYRELRQLSAASDLPPCALFNAKQAMVMLWNACVDLDLVYEEPGCD